MNEIKIKTTKRKKLIQPADPHLSSSKRDVPAIIKALNKQLDKEKNVTGHVHSVLKNSKVGRNSSLGQHLIHSFSLNELGDHQYVSKKDFEKNILCIDSDKNERIQSFFKKNETSSLIMVNHQIQIV